jgi:hypothetical protein
VLLQQLANLLPGIIALSWSLPAFGKIQWPAADSPMKLMIAIVMNFDPG